MARLTSTAGRPGVRMLYSLPLRIAALTLGATVGLAAQVVVLSPEPRSPAPGQPGQRLVPVGPGSISGIVVSATTGRPLPGATVTLQGTAGPPAGADGAIPPPPVVTAAVPGGGSSGPAGPTNLSLSRTVTTDTLGRFAFPALAAGQYAVQVTREGYLPGGSGQERPGGSVGRFRLADREDATLTVPLMRGGAISGHVYDEHGEPVQGAQVRALRLVMRNGIRQPQASASAATDDRGAYRLFGLPPSEYLVAATPRPRLLQAAPDRTAQEMAAIAAASAEGRIQLGAVPGYHPAYVVVPAPPPPTRAAGPVSVSAAQFVPIFAPGTPDRATATIVRVAGGDEHGPYDVMLQSITATLVRAVITPALPDGVSVQVALSPVDPTVGDAMRTGSDATGTFRFQNVPPGRYHLLAQTLVRRTVTPGAGGVGGSGLAGGAPVSPSAPAEPLPTLWAREEITVSGEPEIDVTIALRPPRTLSGRVVFDMPQRPGASAAGQVMLSPAPGPASLPIGGAMQAPIEADGTFTIANVVPGRYILRASGGLLRSSIVEGQDTLDVPIEITGERDIAGAVVTVTSPDRQTTLWGRIADGSEPFSNVTVVVAATDERYWVPGGRRVVVVRTDAWGHYRVGGLPPGTYTVAPAHDLENGEQFDPELLRAIAARGARVTLSEGVSSRQDFRAR